MYANNAALLDDFKIYFKGHRYYPMGDIAQVTTYDGEEWELEYHPGSVCGATMPHIGLSNSLRAISFENKDEFRGWLRCHRSIYYHNN